MPTPSRRPVAGSVSCIVRHAPHRSTRSARRSGSPGADPWCGPLVRGDRREHARARMPAVSIGSQSCGYRRSWPPPPGGRSWDRTSDRRWSAASVRPGHCGRTVTGAQHDPGWGGGMRDRGSRWCCPARASLAGGRCGLVTAAGDWRAVRCRGRGRRRSRPSRWPRYRGGCRRCRGCRCHRRAR